MIFRIRGSILVALGLFIFALLGVLGANAYSQAKAYEEHTAQLVELHAPSEQAKLQLERLTTSLVGDLFGSGQKEGNYTMIQTQQQHHKQLAERYTLYFMVIVACLLPSILMLSGKHYASLLTLLAMMTLFFGLISPLLMVTIHKEVGYLGDIVLSFESKGVMGSIIKLWEGGDLVVALVILIFSVIVPLFKVTSLLFIVIFIESKFAEHMVKFFKAIGKWSMVDVFVVAIFLVYLTANKGDMSRAEIEVGLYFFLAYVILSMLASVSVDRVLQRLKV
jgi:paraquat-inducible protein A